AKEVIQGLVTIDGARDYGVVLNEYAEIDQGKTAALRAEMRATRGDIEVFNFGPSIEQLRGACETETGLPAPRQPVWRSQAG
ncbi:MAG: hydantoinase B/oxoprolinase family protein, partial [Pseudomonadota bacterium]